MQCKHSQPKESNQPTSPSSPSSFLLLLFALTSLPSSGIHGLVGSGSPRSNPFSFSRRGRGRNWGREIWEKKERLSSKNVLKNRYACLIPTFTPFFLLIFSKTTMNFLGVSFRRGGNSAKHHSLPSPFLLPPTFLCALGLPLLLIGT